MFIHMPRTYQVVHVLRKTSSVMDINMLVLFVLRPFMKKKTFQVQILYGLMTCLDLQAGVGLTFNIV